MDNLDNIFTAPTRRDLLRWGLACGAGGVLCRFHLEQAFGQDVAGPGMLPGPKLEGVARHEAMFWENQFRIHLEEAVLFDIQNGRLLLIRRDDTALAFALAARDIGDLRRKEDVDERGLDR